MPAFLDSLDIANRALDNLGLPHILSVDEDSTRNAVMSNVYDKLREAELERNTWKFAKRKVWLRPVTSTSRLLSPDLYNPNETYLPGAIVADANGDLWFSKQADNYGNVPGVSDAWDSYYGPMAIDLYNSAIPYNAGEIVWKPGCFAGTFVIFLSMISNNLEVPDVADAWSSTQQYDLNDRVTYSGQMWRSTITNNLSITPAAPPLAYSSGTVYNTGDTALASDGFIYTATTNNTVGIDPIDDDGTFWTKGTVAGWTMVPTQLTASGAWMPLFSNMINMGPEYIYVAPTTPVNGRQLNVFRIPAGGLRRAKVQYRQRVGADDWEPHGEFITSADAVLLYEHIANIKDVRKMDAMFCEGLAARMAEETCERLTGSDTKVTLMISKYNRFMNEARIINGIEMGPEEPDEDDYITVRTGGPGGYTNAATNWWNT